MGVDKRWTNIIWCDQWAFLSVYAKKANFGSEIGFYRGLMGRINKILLGLQKRLIFFHRTSRGTFSSNGTWLS